MFLLVVACTLMLFMEGSGWPDRNCGQRLVRSRGRFIYDGRMAENGEFPWMVYFTIFITTYHQGACGGSLIKKDVVLTAAHCRPKGFNRTESYIYAGSTDVNDVGRFWQRRKIKQFIIHEDYRGQVTNEHSNDIALIKLTRPFDLETSQGHIGTVCLAVKPPQPGEIVTVTGWGLTSPGGYQSDHLLAITVPVITDEICENTHLLFYQTELMFCAWEDSKQAGRGDSGGPAVVTRARKSVQVGIVSFHGQGKEHASVVFTKVSTYIEWIADRL